jgi:GMP synthase (glutamine-hydrolysing)
MRVLTIVHQRDAGAGVFGEAGREAGHELVEWVPAEGGGPGRDGFGAAMVFGGSMHVDQEDDNPWLADEKELIAELLERGTPVLGVCLGSQLLSAAAGGAPGRGQQPEFGWHEIELAPEAAADPLLSPLPRSFEGFVWHSYESAPPQGARELAASDSYLQAYRLDGAPAWGLQFHAEVTADDLDRWLDNYENDEDVVRLGVDPEAVRAESRERIAGWNELGRGISRRFLAEAERYSGVT